MIVVQVSGALADVVFDVGPIVPADLTSAEAMSLLRALADRYPEHVAVAADEVLARTEYPQTKAWRHPDDVDVIERAWLALTFWRDDVDVFRILQDAITSEQRDLLFATAKEAAEAETGERCLIGAAAP